MPTSDTAASPMNESVDLEDESNPIAADPRNLAFIEEQEAKATDVRSHKRRRMIQAMLGAGVGGTLGCLAYPWLGGPRTGEFTSAMQNGWNKFKEPFEYERKRWARALNDNREKLDQPTRSMRPKPIVLDAEGRAYSAFITSLGLKHISPMEVIRPHFNCRGTVTNSLPPREIWKNMAPTLRAADALRDRLGAPLLTIASAFRSAAYNAACPGAASHSYHMQNMALDLIFDCPPAKVAEVAATLRNQKIFTGGIGRYPSFTHIDTRGKRADWG